MRGACFSSDLTPPGTAYGHSDALSHLQTAEPDPGLPHACGTMPCPPVWAAHSPREGRVRPQRGSAWTTARLCAALRGFAQNRCAAQVRAGVCRTRVAAQRRGSALANHRRARREDERSGAGRVRHQVVAGHGYLLRLVRVADHEESQVRSSRRRTSSTRTPVRSPQGRRAGRGPARRAAPARAGS